MRYGDPPSANFFSGKNNFTITEGFLKFLPDKSSIITPGITPPNVPKRSAASIMSTNLKIAKAYSILVVASIIGHSLSMIKEMLGASYFGVSKTMDAFYAALTVPNIITSVLLSPFSIIFIPIYIKYKLENKTEADRLVSIISNFTLTILIIASIITLAFADSVIKCSSPGLDQETALKAAKMLRIISVSIFFAGGVNIFTGILNAFEHFLWPAVSGMFVTLSTISFMLFFTKTWGIFVMGWGLLVGTIFQFLFLMPFTKKYGFKYYKTLDFSHPEIKKSLNLVLVFFIMAVLTGLNTAIGRFIASWLPGGSIAALAYADKLVQVPLIIFSGSITTAIYPFLSAQAAENKIEDMKDTVSTSIRMTGFIFIPLAFTMIILATPTIQLLFQRGAFDAAATDLTSKIYILYCFQLFYNYALVILLRLLLVFQDFKIILKTTIAGLSANVILNLIFIRLLNPPACGIALAAVLGNFMITVAYFIILKKRISNLHGMAILKSLLKISLFAVASGLAAFWVHKIMRGTFEQTFFNRIVGLIASYTAGLISLISISFAFKLEEFQKIYQLVRTKLRPNSADSPGPAL